MTVNVNEATQKIKKVGATNVRVVPGPNENVQTGQYNIEILESGSWNTIATCPNKKIADDIVGQAVNNVICG
jgi:hypothetical protein